MTGYPQWHKNIEERRRIQDERISARDEIMRDLLETLKRIAGKSEKT